MKGLAFRQPGAALLALGLARFVVRDLPTRYRGPVLICADGRRPRRRELFALAPEVLARFHAAGWRGDADLPRRAILAVARLEHVERIGARRQAPPGCLGRWLAGRWLYCLAGMDPRAPVRLQPLSWRVPTQELPFEVPDAFLEDPRTARLAPDGTRIPLAEPSERRPPEPKPGRRGLQEGDSGP